jgi:regulator of sigma E protease
VERNNERLTFSITTANEGGKGKIGVSPAGNTIRRPVTAKEAGVLAITTPPAVVKDVLVGMFEWVTGKVQAEVGGPVRIVTETASVAKKGWAELFTLLGLLSAYLGAFNLLPIPALDGGRLIFLGFEATTRKKMNATVEAQIHFVGLVMMVGLIIYITIAKDIPFALK